MRAGYMAIKIMMSIKLDALQSIIDSVPMKRLARPEEIGGTLCLSGLGTRVANGRSHHEYQRRPAYQ